MKKYYYTDGQTQFGPFTIEELKEKNLSRDTLIWFQGINDWTPAKDIPALQEIFQGSTPPPFQSQTSSPPPTPPSQSGQKWDWPKEQQSSQTPSVPPKNWLVESILATLFCCLPFGIAGIVNASKVESRFYSGDIDGAKRSAAEAEKWTKVAFYLGLVFYVLYFILIGVAGFSGL